MSDREMKTCSLCDGTGLVPVPSDRACLALINLVMTEDTFYDMTDAELAELLEQRVWSQIPIGDVRSGIVSQAIDRLRRSGGGTLPRPADDGE